MKRWWTSLFFLLLILAMLPALVVIGAALFLARMMIRPRRLPLRHTPRDVGLDYEAVHFDSDDGLYLDGWFIPAPGDGPRPAVVIAHGWPWNRAGTPAQDFFARLTQSPPIDLLRPAQALHQAGFHVLMFDFRNHGLSGSAPYLTFGRDEAADLMGAVRYLRRRPDVDPARVGVLGFSMGGNAVVFACARDDEQAIRAAVAVQPVRPSVFAPRFAATLLGPLLAPYGEAEVVGDVWHVLRASGPVDTTGDGWCAFLAYDVREARRAVRALLQPLEWPPSSMSQDYDIRERTDTSFVSVHRVDLDGRRVPVERRWVLDPSLRRWVLDSVTWTEGDGTRFERTYSDYMAAGDGWIAPRQITLMTMLPQGGSERSVWVIERIEPWPVMDKRFLALFSFPRNNPDFPSLLGELDCGKKTKTPFLWEDGRRCPTTPDRHAD